MILDDDQLSALTQRQRSDAQRRELDHMGIRYRVRRDGSLAVLLRDVDIIDARTIGVREPELQL